MKSLWALLGIIGVDLYLRLWHITSLFKWIHDYDEGAYSVGGLLISQGYVPYQDFTLVHPPLYNLLLAGMYKIFGYNFFYGRYLSVVFSVACIVLAYFIGKKLFNSTAGLISALLFAVFPGFFTLWYRAVQEPLGILLILLGLFFLTYYLKDSKSNYQIILSGVFLGLSIAVKYTFAPAVLGIILSVFILNKFSRESWILAGSVVIGFLTVIAYFLITNPQGFLEQSLLSQFSYRSGGYFYTIYYRIIWFRTASWPDKITTFCIFLPYIVFLLYLIRKHWTRLNVFLTISMFITLLFTAFYDPIEIRYLTPSLIFMFLIISSYVPGVKLREKLNVASCKVLATSLGIVILFACSLIMRQDYNYLTKNGVTYEGNVYSMTAEHFDGVKVYALNPIFKALKPHVFSGVEFDIYGLLFTMNKPADEVMNMILSQNPDYIVTDAFSTLFTMRWKQLQVFYQEMNKHTTFITRIGTGEVSVLEAGIYKLLK